MGALFSFFRTKPETYYSDSYDDVINGSHMNDPSHDEIVNAMREDEEIVNRSKSINEPSSQLLIENLETKADEILRDNGFYGFSKYKFRIPNTPLPCKLNTVINKNKWKKRKELNDDLYKKLNDLSYMYIKTFVYDTLTDTQIRILEMSVEDEEMLPQKLFQHFNDVGSTFLANITQFGGKTRRNKKRKYHNKCSRRRSIA